MGPGFDMRRVLLRTAACALALLVLLAFPFGPLFPWSPWTPGYASERFERAEVLSPAGSAPGEWASRIDGTIRDAERFLGLRMPRRVTVVVCRSWEDFERFMPVSRGRGPGAVALWTGTVIYLTPKLEEKKLDQAEYVRHELAHAAVHQNQGLLDAWRVQVEPWLYEGIAVCFGRQKSYVAPEEFVERTLREDLEPVIDPGLRARATEPADMRFSYQAWRYFLEYLIETEGHERFVRFFAACAFQPEAAPQLFEEAYGRGLQAAIRRFQSDLRDGKWKPDSAFLETRLASPDWARP